MTFVPEPLSAILGGVALLLTALGGMAFWRGSSNGRKADPLEEVRKALVDNTSATAGQSLHFADNNRMFAAVLGHAGGINERLREIERNSAEALSLAKDIHTELVRRSK